VDAGAAVRRRQHAPTKRDKSVLVRLTADEKQRITQAAADAGVAVGAFVAERALAPEELAVRMAASGQSDAQQRVLVDLMGIHRQVRGAAQNLNQAVAVLHSTGQPTAQLAAAADYMRRLAVRADEAVAAVVRWR
jgi:uncharacterized protein (DUF1778 family)